MFYGETRYATTLMLPWSLFLQRRPGPLELVELMDPTNPNTGRLECEAEMEYDFFPTLLRVVLCTLNPVAKIPPSRSLVPPFFAGR